MRFYSWMSDVSLAPWLELYKRRVLAIYNSGIRFYNHVQITDLCWVQMRICGEAVYVNVMGLDTFYFEFATPGHPVITGSFLGTTAYKSAIVGTTVQLQGKSIKLNPTLRLDKRDFDTTSLSLIARPSQVQLANEPVIEMPQVPLPKTGKYKRQLYESWAPMHPHTGVHSRSYNYGGGQQFDPYHENRGPIDAHEARDVNYDVPWMDNESAGVVRLAYLAGATDWPRASGVQMVKSANFADREFAIYVDAFDQFSVFPTSQIEAQDGINQNVNPLYVQTIRPVLPTWVFAKTQTFMSWWVANATEGIVEFPELDWKLHPDGNKACAVVYERVAANFDAAFFADSPSGTPFASTDFDNYRDGATGYDSRQNTSFDTANLPQRYIVGTGLIELTLNIALTGPDPDNYTFSIDVAEIRRPTTSPFCTFLAGYVWHDCKAPDGTPYALAGDLCVLDLERWYRPSIAPTKFPATFPIYQHFYDPTTGATSTIYSLKNLTTGAEINTFYAADMPILDYDMATLSFVFDFNILSARTVSCAKRAGSAHATPANETYLVFNPAAVVYTFNQLREILYPATMDQPTKDLIASYVGNNVRLTVSVDDWTFIPLNVNQNWSSTSDLTDYRNRLSIELGYRTGSFSGPTATFAAWFNAIQSYLPAYGLIYIDTPQFGWYCYADCIVNALAKTPWSTFFVHPSGTWAFFDQSRIYNRFGLPFVLPGLDMDQLTPFDDTFLEHVIYDRVHFEFPTHGTKDTSFLELYNAAQAKSVNVDEPFDAITYPLMQAKFTKQVYTHPGDLVTWLQLKVDWYNGYTGYYMETGLQGGPYTGYIYFGAGGLRDGSMDDLFYPSPAYGGTPGPAQAKNYPMTFSSPVLLSPK